MLPAGADHSHCACGCRQRRSRCVRQLHVYHNSINMLQARTQWHLLLSASSRRQCYAWKHGIGATRVCRHCIKSAAAKTTADRCISKLSSTRLPGCPLRRCRIHPSKSQLAVAFEYKCMAIKRRSFGCSGALRKGITPVSSSCMQVYVASYMQVYIASCKICALLTKNKTPSGHWTGDGHNKL